MSLYKGVLGAASGAGIYIGTYFAVYGAATNVLSQHSAMKPGARAFVAGEACTAVKTWITSAHSMSCTLRPAWWISFDVLVINGACWGGQSRGLVPVQHNEL